MNKKLLLALIALPLIANAEDGAPLLSNTNALQIVPLSQMPVPAEIKNSALARTAEMKNKGYHETNNRYGEYLLNIKRNAVDELKAYRGTQNAYDSHLKATASEMKLAFQFKKLPIENSKIIGYAPVGTYVKNPDGWNGIKVFFEEPNLGICAYEFTDLKLSNGSIQLSKENTEYIVNKKPSSKVIEGNQATAFTYTVVWYDGLKINTLDCATKNYSKDLINNVISLANKIDNR